MANSASHSGRLAQQAPAGCHRLFARRKSHPARKARQKAYVGPDHPEILKMKSFSTKLRKIGITDEVASGLRKADFVEMCEKLGLDANLNKKRNSKAT
jgi:hypothetical protein